MFDSLKDIGAYWNKPIEDNFKSLQANQDGLSSKEAESRLVTYGFNLTAEPSNYNSFTLFLKQFKSPITLLLLGAAILSLFLGDPTDAIIIFTIVGISSLLGFWQEKSAGDAVKKLLSLVEIKANVLRDKSFSEISLKYIVPGDIVKLSAGDVVPADCLLITSNELFTNEAAFTGESFPVEKKLGMIATESPLAARSNMLFMGSNVI